MVYFRFCLDIYFLTLGAIVIPIMILLAYTILFFLYFKRNVAINVYMSMRANIFVCMFPQFV